MPSSVELATGYVALSVSARGVGKDIAREFDVVPRAADKAGKDAGKRLSGGLLGAAKGIAGPLAGLFALDKVKDAFVGVITKAGDLEQSVGGVQAVFKDYATNIEQSSKRAADAVGLSQDAYNSLASTIGSTLKNKGIKDFGKQTETLIGLGADLASQFGGTSKEAVEALSSALRGETDPIERYGVSLNAAAISAEAVAQGLVKPIKNAEKITIAHNRATLAQDAYNKAVKEHGKDSTQALRAETSLMLAQRKLTAETEGTIPVLKDQEKAMAALSIINRQTADAQGNFSRESDTLQGKQQRAAAAWENLSAKIGGLFLPVASDAMGVVAGKLLPALDRFAGVLQSDVVPGVRVAAAGIAGGVKWFRDYQAILIPVAASLGVVALGLKAVAIQQAVIAAGGLLNFIRGVSIATRAWAAAQAVLNVVMTANPIGLVVIAISALVAGLIIAYKRSETFRNVVNGAWGAVKAGAEAVFDWLSKAVVAVINFVKRHWGTMVAILGGPLGLAVLLVTRNWDKIKTAFRSGVDAIGRIWGGLQEKVKEPIRFVVNTVIDKGLLGAFRTISGVVGYDKGKNLHVSAGFHSGGWTGPGSKYQLAGIVHADEFVINKASRRKIERDRPGYLDSLNRYGLPGYFMGGGVQPVPGPGNRHSGYPWARWAGDFPVGMNTPIRAYKAGVVAAVRFLTTSYGRHVRLNHGAEQTLYAHMNSISVSPGQKVGAGQVIGLVGNTGNSKGPHLHFELSGGSGPLDMSTGGGGVIAQVAAFVKAGFDSFTSWFSGLISKPMDRLAEITGSPFGQMVAGIPGLLVDGLKEKVSVFDNGGRLHPGLTFNGTRRSELVLNRPQERIVERALDLTNAGGGVTINGGVHGFSAEDVAREILKLQRRERALQPSYV